MTIAIEKGIIPPPRPIRKGGYPFAQLEVGDSFVVELQGRKSWSFAFKAIQRAQNQHNIKLTTRLIGPDKRRIWRVA